MGYMETYKAWCDNEYFDEATREELKSIASDEKEIEDDDDEPVHGNSAKSTKPQHGYEIYEGDTGNVVKTGISGQKLNADGSSPRANVQVNALNRKENRNAYNAYRSRVVM